MLYFSRKWYWIIYVLVNNFKSTVIIVFSYSSDSEIVVVPIWPTPDTSFRPTYHYDGTLAVHSCWLDLSHKKAMSAKSKPNEPERIHVWAKSSPPE